MKKKNIATRNESESVAVSECKAPTVPENKGWSSDNPKVLHHLRLERNKRKTLKVLADERERKENIARMRQPTRVVKKGTKDDNY